MFFYWLFDLFCDYVVVSNVYWFKNILLKYKCKDRNLKVIEEVKEYGVFIFLNILKVDLNKIF